MLMHTFILTRAFEIDVDYAIFQYIKSFTVIMVFIPTIARCDFTRNNITIIKPNTTTVPSEETK